MNAADAGGAVKTGADHEDIESHYGVSNAFYREWLGPSMVYSCALWENAADLHEAQIAKLDYYVAQSRAHGKARVLDVGCGWGALLRRLVDHHDVGRAIGLTLSREQASWIEADAHPKVEVAVEDWRTYRPEAPFEAIVSIGAFEHFAAHGLPRAVKVRQYADFFERCVTWLAPGGFLSVQSISAQPADGEDVSRFIAQSIFPGSDLPTLCDIADAIPRELELVCLRNDRLDYSRTCNEWLHNLRARRATCIEKVGAATVEKYERYLGMSAIGFHVGRTGLLRFTLRRRA
jgi:cyclopropane-fatty-acyl-phospholipid synthase